MNYVDDNRMVPMDDREQTMLAELIDVRIDRLQAELQHRLDEERADLRVILGRSDYIGDGWWKSSMLVLKGRGDLKRFPNPAGLSVAHADVKLCLEWGNRPELTWAYVREEDGLNATDGMWPKRVDCAGALPDALWATIPSVAQSRAEHAAEVQRKKSAE